MFLKEPIQGHLQCHIYCPNCEYYIGDKVSEGQCTVWVGVKYINTGIKFENGINVKSPFPPTMLPK